MSTPLTYLREAEPSHPVAEDVIYGREVERGNLQTSLFELVWRHRWVVVLCTVFGAGGALLFLLRATPLYTSTSRVYVERNLPQILEGQVQMGHTASYLHTQVELIRSTPVLSSALQLPGIDGLTAFRGVSNPIALLKSLTDVSVGQDDEIINVSIELPDPREAAQIVNAVVEAYISRYAAAKNATTAEVLRILRNEKEIRDNELDERSRAMQEFRAANPAFSIVDESGNVITRQFAVVAEELGKAKLELMHAKSAWDRAQRMYTSPHANRALLQRLASESHDVELENQIQQIEFRLSNRKAVPLSPRTVKWLETYLAELKRTAAAQRQKALRQALQTAVVTEVETAQQDYLLLEGKVQELQQEYEKQLQQAKEVSTKAAEFAALQEAYHRAAQTCDLLDERIKEVNLTENAGAMNVTIIEAAEPARFASYPHRPKVMSLGIALGLVTGLGLVWLRDFLDHRLRSLDEITSILQLPILGVLPTLGSRFSRLEAGRMVADQPRSAMAEAVRTLRTAIHFGLADGAADVILVTSPAPADGKSTVASNLAIAMAQADQAVLLVDADFRKPTQHTVFEVPNEGGLSTIMAERRLPDVEIIPSGIDSLDLLPCGPMPPNPVELLNNGFFRKLLDDLRGRYDKVIIDSAPIMPVADSRILAAVVDATVLVLRAGKSSRRPSVAARNELWRVRAQHVGVAVNAAPQPKRGDGYSGYGYGYGYGQGGYGELPEKNGRSRVALPSHAEASSKGN